MRKKPTRSRKSEQPDQPSDWDETYLATVWAGLGSFAEFYDWHTARVADARADERRQARARVSTVLLSVDWDGWDGERTVIGRVLHALRAESRRVGVEAPGS